MAWGKGRVTSIVLTAGRESVHGGSRACPGGCEDLEGQQAKLKEVRDRLDRISRDDNQYLELATQGAQDAAGRLLPHLAGGP